MQHRALFQVMEGEREGGREGAMDGWMDGVRGWDDWREGGK